MKIIFIALLLNCSITYAKGTLSIGHQQRQNTLDTVRSDFSSFAELSLVRKKRDDDGFSYQYDLGVRKYNNSSSALYALSEAFASYKNKDLVISLGRKVLDWNPASRYWALGEVFATKGFNLARDQQEGTTGAHIEYRLGNFFVHAVASGVFIPQLNPGTEILEGKIGPKSEWSNPPPSRVRFEGQNIPIVYNVEMPNASDFVRQETFALRMGLESSIGRFSVHAGRKPEASPRINASGALSLENGGEVIVNAKPFVNRQSFYGGSWQKSWNKNLMTAVDYQYISPDRGEDRSFSFEGFRIEPVYTNISYASFHTKWSEDFFSFSLSGLKAFKNYQSSDATFEKRLRWQESLGLDMKVIPFDRFTAGARYQRDLQREDSVMSLYSAWSLSRKLVTSLEYQEIEAPSDQSFWSAYRSNDLWQINVNYLF